MFALLDKEIRTHSLKPRGKCSLVKIPNREMVPYGIYLKPNYGAESVVQLMKNRRGISPVIGEFMLICVAIIVAYPLIGITFGSMGHFTSPALTEVSSSSCGGNETVTSCTFTITNLGAGNTQTEPTAILYVSSGNQTKSSVSHACLGNNFVVKGGSALTLNCSFDVAAGSPGDEYYGSIILSNGASLPFIGRF